jgi:hypothetical protein
MWSEDTTEPEGTHSVPGRCSKSRQMHCWCEELLKRWATFLLAQDRVQWRALVLSVPNLRILLPWRYLISKMDRSYGKGL